MTSTTLPPRPGDFAVVVGTLAEAWKTRNFFAALIEAVTRGHAYHAVMYLGDGIGMEARPSGAGHVEMSHYAGHLRWSHLDLTDEQRQIIVATAESFQDVPYNYKDDLAIGLDALGFHSKKVLDRLHDSNTIMCSQLVAVSLAAAGATPAGLTKEPWRTTPNDLNDVILGEIIPLHW